MNEVSEQVPERDGARSIPTLVEKVDLPVEPREQLEQVPRLGRYQDQRARKVPSELEVRSSHLVSVRKLVQQRLLASCGRLWGEVAQRSVVLIYLIVDVSEQASDVSDQVLDAAVYDNVVRPE